MWAYLTLFGWSFLAATVLPLGSEPAVIALAAQGHSTIAIVGTATIGNYLGACTTYWIGRGAASALQGRTLRQREIRATRIIAKYGPPALILSWVPIIGDLLVAAAGAAKLGFWKFSAWTFIGKLARYAALAWAVASW